MSSDNVVSLDDFKTQKQVPAEPPPTDPEAQAARLVDHLITDLKLMGYYDIGVIKKHHEGIEHLIGRMEWEQWPREIWEHRDLLYAHERDFVGQMLTIQTPSAKQILWLAKIHRSLQQRAEEAANPVRKKAKKPKLKAPAFEIGARVSHPKFGDGAVVEIKDSRTVIVKFDNHDDPKRIVPEFLSRGIEQALQGH
jgi:hypothetical protein